MISLAQFNKGQIPGQYQLICPLKNFNLGKLAIKGPRRLNVKVILNEGHHHVSGQVELPLRLSSESQQVPDNKEELVHVEKVRVNLGRTFALTLDGSIVQALVGTSD